MTRIEKKKDGKYAVKKVAPKKATRKVEKPYKLSQTGYTMALMKQLEKGSYFFTERPPADCMSYAVKFKLKVKTSILLTIEGYSGSEPVTSRITKVTIL